MALCKLFGKSQELRALPTPKTSCYTVPSSEGLPEATELFLSLRLIMGDLPPRLPSPTYHSAPSLILLICSPSLPGSVLHLAWSQRGHGVFPSPPHPEYPYDRLKILLKGDPYLKLRQSGCQSANEVVLLVRQLLIDYEPAVAAPRRLNPAPLQPTAARANSSSSSTVCGSKDVQCQQSCAVSGVVNGQQQAPRDPTMSPSLPMSAPRCTPLSQAVPCTPIPMQAGKTQGSPSAAAAVIPHQLLPQQTQPPGYATAVSTCCTPPLPPAASSPPASATKWNKVQTKHQQQLGASASTSTPVASVSPSARALPGLSALLPVTAMHATAPLPLGNPQHQQQGGVPDQPSAHLLMELERMSSPGSCASADIVLLDFAAAAGGAGGISSAGKAYDGTRGSNLGILMDNALRHISACNVVGMDCEHADPLPAVEAHAQAAGQAAAAAAGVKDGGRVHSSSSSRGQGKKKLLAMLQLMVPAVAAGSSPTSSSSAAVWPARIYLIALPQPQEAAAAVFHQLQPMLTSSSIVKVMHDARQVGACQTDSIHQGGMSPQCAATCINKDDQVPNCMQLAGAKKH